MGLFDAIKSESQRIFVARPDEAKNALVYRHPENNVRNHTQLTVDSDEAALFFRDGKVVGRLGPGRHTLDSSNVPFLTKTVEQYTGGNLFVAEIYFVTLREFAGIKFGGPIG